MKISEMTDEKLIEEVESHFQLVDVTAQRVKQLMFIDSCIEELERRGYDVDIGSNDVIIEKDEDFEDA